MEVLEYDEAGSLLASYVESGSTFTVRRATSTKSYLESLLDIFMPAGYPASVTDDYLAYQTFDSLQAFASSIAGMLASRAVLEGKPRIGVGDEKSHPTTALLLSVFQESFGRIVTIIFAHRFGSALEPECKMYRFAADIFNDAAFILDCLSPAFPKRTRVLIFSSASMLRALCGVAAGSAKASLSAHFAISGNLGDVNAKDSSQETVISLLGMLAGSLVVSWISSPAATWVVLVIMLTLHLALNYAAVRSVSMKSLNRQRANLVFSHLLAFDKVLTPKQVSQSERIFERDGVLRWCGGQILGFARIGVGLSVLCKDRQSPESAKAPHHNGMPYLSSLMDIFWDEQYVLTVKGTSMPTIHIALKSGCTSLNQLKAWFHGLILAKHILDEADTSSDHAKQISDSDQGTLKVIRQSLTRANNLFDEYSMRVQSAGWAMDAALETQSGPRITLRR